MLTTELRFGAPYVKLLHNQKKKTEKFHFVCLLLANRISSVVIPHCNCKTRLLEKKGYNIITKTECYWTSSSPHCCADLDCSDAMLSPDTWKILGEYVSPHIPQEQYRSISSPSPLPHPFPNAAGLICSEIGKCTVFSQSV